MKHQVGTSIEEAEMLRVKAIKEKLNVSESWVLRRAVMLGLADVEREVMGMTPVPISVPVPVLAAKLDPKKGKAA